MFLSCLDAAFGIIVITLAFSSMVSLQLSCQPSARRTSLYYMASFHHSHQSSAYHLGIHPSAEQPVSRATDRLSSQVTTLMSRGELFLLTIFELF